MRILFIGGIGRSGSTLAERLLADAAGAVAVGELQEIWDYGYADDAPCSCGEAFMACAFWRAVTARAFGAQATDVATEARRLRAEVERYRYVVRGFTGFAARPPRGPRAERYRDINRRLYGAIAAVAGTDLVVDASKVSRRALFVAHLGFETRLVHLVRDPRAVAFSWGREPSRARSRDEIWSMPRYGPLHAAGLYWLENLGVELVRSMCAAAVVIRYEDLARDPAATVVNALAGLGLPQTGPVAPSIEDPARYHTINGNPVRFRRHLAITPDDRWRTAMHSAARRVVTVGTAPLLWRYGYTTTEGRV